MSSKILPVVVDAPHLQHLQLHGVLLGKAWSELLRLPLSLRSLTIGLLVCFSSLIFLCLRICMLVQAFARFSARWTGYA